MNVTRTAFAGVSAAVAAAAGGKFFRVETHISTLVVCNALRRAVFSVAINHIDFTTLRYEENFSVWRERCGNCEERWIRTGVRPNLLDWGFISVGRMREVMQGTPTNRRHSQPRGVRALRLALYAVLASATFRRNSSVRGGDEPSRFLQQALGAVVRLCGARLLPVDWLWLAVRAPAFRRVLTGRADWLWLAVRAPAFRVVLIFMGVFFLWFSLLCLVCGLHFNGCTFWATQGGAQRNR